MELVTFYGRGFVATVPPQSYGSPLIPQPLIIAPGFYSYNGRSYDMTAEGLYRFVHTPSPAEPWSDGGHRIVAASDPDRLMSALAGVTVHGTVDEALTDAQRTQAARVGWLRMRCGHIDAWARGRMSQCGFVSRTVSFVTLGQPNDYDDGHVCTEVRIGNAWRLYDLDFNRVFRKLDQTYMAAKDSRAIMYGAYTSEQIIATATPHNVEPSVNALYESIVLESTQGVEGWTRRIFQAVGIWDTDGLCYFRIPAGFESRKAWLLSLSTAWRVIDDPAAWEARFYS